MPEMDGFELCREIRSRPGLAGIKIIMCTSKSYDFDRRRAKELGADGYIVKPIKRESLMKQINEIMSESVTVTYWGVHGTLAGKRREHHALRWKYLLHEYRDQRRAAVHLRLRLGYQAAL
ncbi:MAG: response regulator, partial [Burkholderiales bacterium]|nr:response regulator [Burkholderiales bacterium]